jgi:hypothetical protein
VFKLFTQVPITLQFLRAERIDTFGHEQLTDVLKSSSFFLSIFLSSLKTGPEKNVFNPDLKIIIVTIKPDQSHKNGSTFFLHREIFLGGKVKKKF